MSFLKNFKMPKINIPTNMLWMLIGLLIGVSLGAISLAGSIVALVLVGAMIYLFGAVNAMKKGKPNDSLAKAREARQPCKECGSKTRHKPNCSKAMKPKEAKKP